MRNITHLCTHNNALDRQETMILLLLRQQIWHKLGLRARHAQIFNEIRLTRAVEDIEHTRNILRS